MDSIKCDYLAKAQAFYNYNIWSKFGSPKGVTIEAVRELERKMGVKFPHAFVEYLRWMGRDNPIYIGSDAYFEHILPNGPMLAEPPQSSKAALCKAPLRGPSNWRQPMRGWMDFQFDPLWHLRKIFFLSVLRRGGRPRGQF